MDEDFLRAATVGPLRNKIRRLATGERGVVFDHVVPQAQPFLAAVVIRQLAASARLWIVCETEREQERFHGELTTWIKDAAFFPTAEIAMVEGALPDPEVAAERLAVLQKLTTEEGLVLVIHEKSLDENVSSAKSLEKLQLDLAPSTAVDRDALVRQLVTAGYENVPQVSDRGQFAVRGGVMDVYSWHHALPIRLEWMDTC